MSIWNFLNFYQDLTLINELICHPFAKEPSLLQQIKTSFTTLRADNMFNTVDFCIAAGSGKPSGSSKTESISHIETLRMFIPTELFVEDLTQALSYVQCKRLLPSPTKSLPVIMLRISSVSS
jgi:hypothetical protein